MLPVLALAVVGCGGEWTEASLTEVHGGFPFCGHAAVSCDACHAPDEPVVVVDPSCLGCHEGIRPASHDPETTRACEVCHGGCDWSAVGNHPDGFEAPELHGVAFNLQDPEHGDCRTCHGADLRGADGVQGCDGCHAASGHEDWRTDCVYCHGGSAGDTVGLPPEDLDGTDVQRDSTFPSHRAHSDDDQHPAYGCESCHPVASLDYLDAVTDPGHVYDDTPRAADVELSVAGSYAGDSCSVYCHGNGLGTGTVENGTTPRECDDCHRIPPGGTEEHTDHDHDRVSCDWCHASVAASSSALASAALHVDGTVQVAFSAEANQWEGMTWSEGRCTGRCHVGGESRTHEGDRWD